MIRLKDSSIQIKISQNDEPIQKVMLKKPSLIQKQIGGPLKKHASSKNLI